MIHLAPVQEIGRADDVRLALPRQVVLPDDDQAVGVVIGQALDEQRVDDAEDCRIGADADGQRENRDDAESRRANEQAQSEPEILKHCAHADMLLRDGGAACVPQASICRLLRSPTLPDGER